MDNAERKYIDAEEAIAEIRKWYFNADIQKAKDDPCVIDAMIDLFIRTIRAQKPADVKPIKRGQWIHDINNLYGCSECGERETMSHTRKKRFCPGCGSLWENAE